MKSGMKKFGALALLMTSLTLTALAGYFDWEKAVSLYKQGQYREAIVEFQRVLVEYPEHADSWKFVGLSYYLLKEYQPAIEPLEKALDLKRKEGRNDLDLLRALGQANLSLSRFEQALPYFESLARMQMNVAANFYMLGVTYANLNRGEDAVAAFQKAVKLDPKDGDSWYYIAGQYFRAGKMAETIDALRQGLAAAPKNPEMLGLMAESCLRQGAAATDEKAALASFEEAIKSALDLKAVKDDAAANELLGRSYLAAKKFAPAEQSLTRALEMNKQPTAALYFNLGFAHAQNKTWNRAAEMLTQADRLSPGDLNTLYYLGYVYENLRKYQQAYDAYLRAYEISGRSNADLKASLDRVSTIVKQ